nr:MAG TPA: hypothetical protein [Caudoviricetes sp.]
MKRETIKSLFFIAKLTSYCDNSEEERASRRPALFYFFNSSTFSLTSNSM